MKEFIVKALALVVLALILFLPGCGTPGKLGLRFGGPEDTGEETITKPELPGQGPSQDLAVALTYDIPLELSTDGRDR